MLRRPVAVLAVVLSALVGLTACDATTYVDSSPGRAAPTSGAGWQPTGPIALDLPTSHALTENAALPPDSTPVLVNIWASTCVPCRTELPLLQEIDTAGTLKVIGYSRDVSSGPATSALDAAGVTYPNWLDTDASIAVALDGRIPVNAIPSSFLIRGGKVVAVHIGAFSSKADVLKALEIK
ncbi:MAG: TlpA family protein disulfide reductase [Marmoricola sp.]